MDSFFSLFATALQKQSTQPITLLYAPGRGGSTALNRLIGKPDDGYAVAGLFIPSFLLQPDGYDPAYAEADIAPVAILAYAPAALWVPADSPHRTVSDLTAFALAPGNRLIIAGNGSLTDHHMASLLLDRAAGITSAYMPVLDSVQAVEAAIAGKAAACWGHALAPDSMPGMRPIAVAALSRSPALPDVPTFEEQRIRLVIGQHIGIGLPGKAREEIRRTVSGFFLRAAAEPDFTARAAAAGLTLMPTAYKDMPGFLEHQRRSLRAFLDEYPLLPQRR